jgi:hypothetical protein
MSDDTALWIAGGVAVVGVAGGLYWMFTQGQKTTSSTSSTSSTSGTSSLTSDSISINSSVTATGLSAVISGTVTSANNLQVTTNISWGDGTTSNNITLPQTHTYPSTGSYTITISASDSLASNSATATVNLTSTSGTILNNGPTSVTPTIGPTTSSVQEGGTFGLVGSGFTPNGQVNIRGTINGSLVINQTVTASVVTGVTGGFAQITVTAPTTSGTLAIIGVDVTTGISSTATNITVTGSSSSNTTSTALSQFNTYVGNVTSTYLTATAQSNMTADEQLAYNSALASYQSLVSNGTLSVSGAEAQWVNYLQNLNSSITSGGTGTTSSSLQNTGILGVNGGNQISEGSTIQFKVSNLTPGGTWYLYSPTYGRITQNQPLSSSGTGSISYTLTSQSPLYDAITFSTSPPSVVVYAIDSSGNQTNTQTFNYIS